MSIDQLYLEGMIVGLRNAQHIAFEMINDQQGDSDTLRMIHKAIIEEVDTLIPLQLPTLKF